MKRVFPLALLLAGTLLCLDAHAATDAEEQSLIIKFDHEALTKQVLEKFPDGLPFDRTGAPTDINQAQEFWQLLADWPISLGGEVTDLRKTLQKISDETGLPIYLDAYTIAQLVGSDPQKQMVSMRAGARLIVNRLGHLEVGPFKGFMTCRVTPYGLLVQGTVDPDDLPSIQKWFRVTTWWWNKDAVNTRVQVEFPNGPPFDEKGNPTDFNEAKKYWQLFLEAPAESYEPADDPVIGISVATGLPIYLDLEAEKTRGKIALAVKQENRTLGDVLQATMKSDRAQLTPYGVLAQRPKNAFRWRENFRKKIDLEFPDGWDPMNASDEEREKVLWIVAEARCDFILTEPMRLIDFVDWFARASQQNFVMMPIVSQSPSETEGASSPPLDVAPPKDPRRIEPVTFRFAKNIDTLNAALESAGLKALPGGNGFLIVPKGLTEEELEKLRRQDVESTRQH